MCLLSYANIPVRENINAVAPRRLPRRPDVLILRPPIIYSLNRKSIDCSACQRLPGISTYDRMGMSAITRLVMSRATDMPNPGFS
jgi:hypothetical protein